MLATKLAERRSRGAGLSELGEELHQLGGRHDLGVLGGIFQVLELEQPRRSLFFDPVNHRKR